MSRRIRIGTRGSALALAQSQWVADRLEQLGCQTDLEIIKTTGDQITNLPLGSIGVKGLFVSEIENALLEGRIDLAIHSMKDLPGSMPDGLMLAAVPKREDPRDVLVGHTAADIASLKENAIVGTSSGRRKQQLLISRPDVEVADLRGNIDTRLRKLDEGRYDAICIAAAGLHRLGLQDRITQYIDVDMMVPAVGQGALALQTRVDDSELYNTLQFLNDENSRKAVRGERAVLAALGGGCSIPLGVLGRVEEDVLYLDGILCQPDGNAVVRAHISGTEPPESMGRELALRLWRQGGYLFSGLNPDFV